ncbi:MAG: TIGR03915 family putative DNA repair protein [Eubacteriales bacterium]|nr:TIGR03915 family putative DNA repair protein [Eubacteriales bacterium]
MDYEKRVLICEDTLEGIFSAVYDGWHYGAKGLNVEIVTREPDDIEFFCTYETIPSDGEKAQKVARSVRRKLGYSVYEHICYAAVSAHPDKGTAVFRVLLKALGNGKCRRDIMEALADPDVCLVAKLRTKVWHELHRFYGFVRFREIGGGVLFARITPDNDILLMLAPHFADRFPNENWMIYDAKRQKALLHPRGGEYTLRTGIKLTEEYREAPGKTEEYEELWKAFCKSITVEARKNPGLQQQFVPLKFRPDMVEFERR